MLQTLVPPEDEAIASALAELDGKLSAWLAAVTATQALLVERVSIKEPAGHVSRGIVAEETSAEQPVEAVEPVQTHAFDVNTAAPDEPELRVPGEPDERAAARVEAIAEPKAPKRRPTSGTRGIVSYVNPDPPAESSEPPPRDASTDDDEALLATLDEKTVNALRMMRRLSPVRRSMRELLAEYQAEQGVKPDEPAPARTSWWKRK